MCQLAKAQTFKIQLGHHGHPVVTIDKVQGQILAVGYGMGVDSTAMLVLLNQRGIRPDVITFADTGEEKAATYAYLAIINAWCAKVGFPQITIVRNNKTYATLGDAMLKRNTMPSIAFGKHSCSQSFKASPQETWMNAYKPAQINWTLGMKVVKCIGYDDGIADRKRCGKAEASAPKSFLKYTYVYPLQEAGIDRDGCKALIEAAGLPVPPKSSCTFCTAMHKEEIVDVAETEPAKMARALKIEAKWLADPTYGPLRKDGVKVTVQGLGRRFAWHTFLATAHPALLARLEAEHDCGQEERQALAAARALQKP